MAQAFTVAIKPTPLLPLKRQNYGTKSKRVCFKVQAATASTTDFKNGMALMLNGQPFKIVEFQHVHPGRGASFCRTKVRNYLTGNTKEETFRNGTTFDVPNITNLEMQYTYKDEEQYVFMDMETFEECRCPPGDFEKFITEGMNCQILQWDGKVIGVEPPEKVTLEVTMCDPGLKGNTASGGGDKPATCSTGLTVTVPAFINIGDKIIVSTVDGGSYKERAK